LMVRNEIKFLLLVESNPVLVIIVVIEATHLMRQLVSELFSDAIVVLTQVT
jgi:hypothetical protein